MIGTLKDIVAYHSTSPETVQKILETGWRVPREVSHAATDGRVGDFFPAIFFARRPDRHYGRGLIKVRLHGRFIPWRARKGETASVTLHRLLRTAAENGRDGVDSGTDTVGIAVINPAAITILEVL